MRYRNNGSSLYLCRDSFIPTHKAECGDYTDGTPMTEEEFDGK